MSDAVKATSGVLLQGCWARHAVSTGTDKFEPEHGVLSGACAKEVLG